MLYGLKLFLKKLLPYSFVLFIHKLRAGTAAFYYGFPGKRIKVIGVTGTKGKTTTANLITSILERAGHKVAMFSTANMKMAGEESPNTVKLTTPSPFFLQKFLAEAVRKKCDWAVIEVSSHALKQHRLCGVDFKTVVITNLMPDHLDYHKDAAEYRDIHLKMIGPKTEAVIINGEDEQITNLIRQLADKAKNFKIISFGLSNNNLRGYGVQLNSGSVKFKVEYRQKDLGSPREIPLCGNFASGEIISLGEFALKIPGKFNVYNALAAIAVGLSADIDPQKIKNALEKTKSIPGRMERIFAGEKQDFEVIVDYAHSPDSLKAVYEAVKPYVKNRLIAVLGGTGDRDKTYRAKAGALADQFSDIVIVTNEDPYSEDPEDIMEQVINGIKNKILGKNLFRILDRKEAIANAVGLAQKGDTILITGKGAEQFMIWGEEKIPWDDRKIAKQALEKRFNG